MTTVWPVSPWRRAFMEERCLPASVWGPVECWELARLISARANRSDILYSLGLSHSMGRRGGAVSGSGRCLKGRGWGTEESGHRDESRRGTPGACATLWGKRARARDRDSPIAKTLY